jgi:hypothetical protein
MASSTSPVARVLADLKRTLDALGVRWFVFGAQAAILHGTARLTADVDVTVDLGTIAPQRLMRMAKKNGLDTQIPSADFIAVTRVIPLVHRASRFPVDLVLAGPGLEDLFFERAAKLRVGRVVVPVASLEDLIVMKVIASRPKDLEDIEALLASRADVNVAQVRDTLSLAEAALDQSDLTIAFEACLGRRRPVRQVGKTRKKKLTRAVAGDKATRARAASARKEPTKPRATRKTKAKR